MRPGAGLTAFLGNFYGIYLNLVTIVLQVVFTAFVVQRLGVGGTLQVMPVTIALTSVATFFFSGVWAAGALRLTEAATRYTLNRTGMELLYLPLPLELKNRTKAFIDIFVDRFGRGVGGMLLILLTTGLHFTPRVIALVTAGFAIPWILLSHVASREYIATVRKRLSARRLNFSEARVDASDRRTVQLVEETAESENPRQVAYALSLLSDVQGYDIAALLKRHSRDSAPAVRQAVFEIAAARKLTGFEAEARESMSEDAVAYLLAVAPDPEALMAELLRRNSQIAEAAVHSAGGAAGRGAIRMEWVEAAAADPDPKRRHLAAAALALTGDAGLSTLKTLMGDTEPEVQREAICSAGKLRNRALTRSLMALLAKPGLRADVLEALAAYGDEICGTLSEMMDDESLSASVRAQAPRVLKLIRTQHSVDTLVKAIGHGNRGIRTSVLKALNTLRIAVPDLDYHHDFVNERILEEAREYFEQNAALASFIDVRKPRSAAGLLARTMDQRLHDSVERLFRLLGLRYPPVEIYSAYLAYRNRRGEELSTALEFLDNTLDKNLKRVVLPMLDEPDHVQEMGRRLFGFVPRKAEDAVRELMGSSDPWLAACALQAARELKLTEC